MSPRVPFRQVLQRTTHRHFDSHVDRDGDRCICIRGYDGQQPGIRSGLGPPDLWRDLDDRFHALWSRLLADRCGCDGLGFQEVALAAAGIINGMGSIGSMAQEIVLPKVMEYSKDGAEFVGIGFTATEATFAVLIVASMMSICPLLVVRMRNKKVRFVEV